MHLLHCHLLRGTSPGSFVHTWALRSRMPTAFHSFLSSPKLDKCTSVSGTTLLISLEQGPCLTHLFLPLTPPPQMLSIPDKLCRVPKYEPNTDSWFLKRPCGGINETQFTHQTTRGKYQVENNDVLNE